MPRRHVTKSRRQSYSARHHDGGEIARRIVRRADQQAAYQSALDVAWETPVDSPAFLRNVEAAEQAGWAPGELQEAWGK